MSCNDIVQQSASRNFNPPLNIVLPTDAAYDASRAINNSRFDLRPCAIAYCLNEQHVAFCLQYCSSAPKPFRVRAGGHQHEGMCSGNDVLIIDISGMKDPIQFLPGNQALIPAGKQLGDGTMPGTVYYEVGRQNLVFPGGGCESVHIGGLLQGGGWGFSSRMYGLTCDSLIEATVVLASGQTVTARSDNQYNDLFQALKGGGGGNFGVVTKYLVQLYPTTTTQRWLFTISWTRPDMSQVTILWANVFSGNYKGYDSRFYSNPPGNELIPNINSGLRLNVVADDTKEAVVLNGLFYGNETDLNLLLAPFIAITPLNINIRQPAAMIANPGDDLGTLDPHVEMGRIMQPTIDPPTCDGKPHPHKISSCFPVDFPSWGYLTQGITQYLDGSPYSIGVRKYINLMSMQGKIKDIPSASTAFPYRSRPFMMQMQAWWDDSSDDYVSWIANFRKALAIGIFPVRIPLIQGAFINFPDKNMDPSLDISTPVGKLQLLSYYYGNNLSFLRDVKTKYDPRNLFSFEMSIPNWETVKFTAAVINRTEASEQAVYMNNRPKAVYYNTCRNGLWDSAIPLIRNDQMPVIRQLATYITWGNSQYFLLLDTYGKLWQIDAPYNNNATLTSLDSIFNSSPDKLNYHLKNISVAQIHLGQLLVYMITASGSIWQMNFNNEWWGAQVMASNLPVGLKVVTTCTDQAGYYLHMLVLDMAGLLWYYFDYADGYDYYPKKNFIAVLDAMQKTFPAGMPVRSIKSASCSSDAKNTAHIAVIDAVQWDLWYIQHQENGLWNYNFVNIQEIIKANNPSFQKVTDFVSVVVSYETAYNTVHIYASDLKNVIRHTMSKSNGAWTVFDIVPT